MSLDVCQMCSRNVKNRFFGHKVSPVQPYLNFIFSPERANRDEDFDTRMSSRGGEFKLEFAILLSGESYMSHSLSGNLQELFETLNFY